MALTAELLEFRQALPLVITFEARIVRFRSSGKSPPQTHFTVRISNPVPNWGPGTLYGLQAPCQHVERKYRRRAVSTDAADNHGARGRRMRVSDADAFVGFDQYGVVRARVPVDDLVFKLPLHFVGIMKQHEHVTAVGVHGYQPRDAVNDIVVFADRLVRAQQAHGGRPAAPREPKLIRLAHHDFHRTARATLALNDHHRRLAVLCLNQRQVSAIRRNSYIGDTRPRREYLDRGWRRGWPRGAGGSAGGRDQEPGMKLIHGLVLGLARLPKILERSAATKTWRRCPRAVRRQIVAAHS